jgi:hypothetical protein
MAGHKVNSATARCPGKMENIIVLGSEHHYNSFWWKMMFFSPGVGLARGRLQIPAGLIADRTTILYVKSGYVRSELLALDYVRQLGVNVVEINSSSALITYLNTRTHGGERYDILRLVFICHGLPNLLALNLDGATDINIDRGNLTSIRADSFCTHARVYSYACRTGVSNYWESYDNLAQAKPENSLAQKLADHLNIKVHAFYRRTLFRECIRAPADEDSIKAAMKSKRPGHEGEVLDLSTQHEALPHAGQGTSRHYGIVRNGQIAEGTSEYSLWRKIGGITMPTSASDPTGLPNGMHLFEPS